MTPSRYVPLWRAAPVAIVLLGLLLRVQGIDATSLWLDEAYSWEQSANTFWGMIIATSKDNYPPLHNVLLYFAKNAFGDSELVLRVPSVILGTATIYLVYRVGREMFGHSTGIIAALLISVSVFHVWYSIEARMYALLCFTTVLYVWSALHARGKDRLRPHILCAICGALMLYSHVFGMFNFIAVNAAILVQAASDRRLAAPSLRKWLIGQGIAVLLFLPWALLLLIRLPNAEETIGWIADPTLSHVTLVLQTFLGGLSMVWALVLVALAGMFAVLIFPSTPGVPVMAGEVRSDYTFSLILIYALIFVPFFIALVMSWLFTPLLVSRYLIGSLPAVFILVGHGVTVAFRHPLFRAGAVAILVLPTTVRLDVIAETGWRKHLSPDFARFEDLREAGDTVAFVPFRDPTFQYYVRDRSRLNLQVFDWAYGQKAPQDMLRLNRVWVFALLQERGNLGALMDQLVAAGFTEEVRADNDRMVFSLFTRPPASGAPTP